MILTNSEFAIQVLKAGGIYEALFGYGLTSDNLADKDSEVYRELVKLESMATPFNDQIDKVADLLTDAWVLDTEDD